MKTKNNPTLTANLKLFLVLPAILLVLITFSSCAAKKKVATVHTEIAPPPPPPPPPQNPRNPGIKDDLKVVKEEVSDESATVPYVVVEEMPMFPGGDSTLLAFISQNVKYPETAKKNNIQGKVILRFCITANGNVDRVSVLRGVDPDLDAEAVRVASALPAFKPGKQGGKPVPVWYMIPVTFTLK
jgi:TonB family protein